MNKITPVLLILVSLSRTHCESVERTTKLELSTAQPLDDSTESNTILYKNRPSFARTYPNSRELTREQDETYQDLMRKKRWVWWSIMEAGLAGAVSSASGNLANRFIEWIW